MGDTFLTDDNAADTPEDSEILSDIDAIALVRGGDRSAFEVLYSRHLTAASYVAKRQLDNSSDSDDAVAEAFASVLKALLAGGGPDTFFRAYLLTAVRRISHKRNTASSRVQTVDEVSGLDTVFFDEDTVLREFESTAMSTAFMSLPERWQAVLWYVDVEGMKPGSVAPILGLSANGISSLAIRAREGLRRAYLQSHVSLAPSGCEEYAENLGAFSRNGLKRTTHERVEAHLLDCTRCTSAFVEINDVQASMRAHLFPLITGFAFSTSLSGTAGISGIGVLSQAGGSPTHDLGTIAKVGAKSPRVLSRVLIASGLAATVALTAWFIRPQTTEVASTMVLPSQASSSPRVTVSATPSPVPVPEGTATAPAVLTHSAVPSNTASAAPAATAAAPSPSQAAPSSSPSAKAGAVVGDSQVATSTPVPAPTRTYVAPLQTVSSNVSSISGGTSSTASVAVAFVLAGEGAPTSMTANFSVPAGMSFTPQSWSAPAGWTCVQSASQLNQLACQTTSANPSALQFTLPVTIDNPSAVRRLDFTLSGQGVTSTSFSNTFA